MLPALVAPFNGPFEAIFEKIYVCSMIQFPFHNVQTHQKLAWNQTNKPMFKKL